jgi:hypothetical protein
MHRAKLAFGARCQQCPRNVVGKPDGPENAQNPVALLNGIIQPLEQKDPCAFAYDEAIASVIERPGHSSAA